MASEAMIPPELSPDCGRMTGNLPLSAQGKGKGCRPSANYERSSRSSKRPAASHGFHTAAILNESESVSDFSVSSGLPHSY